MNPVAILNTQFVQVALPIIITIMLSAWHNNKRFDDFRADLNRRLDEVIKRLDKIDENFKGYGERITRVEERTSLIRGGR